MKRSSRKPRARLRSRIAFMRSATSTICETPSVTRYNRHRKRDTQPRWRIACQLCIVMCGGLHMATNLSIDPDLIERALEVSGERTKRAAVTKALQEFIARRKQKRVLCLMGTPQL